MANLLSVSHDAFYVVKHQGQRNNFSTHGWIHFAVSCSRHICYLLADFAADVVQAVGLGYLPGRHEET